MNKKRKSRTNFIVQCSMIAAAYAALTLLISPLSYGATQFRFSEALTVLPVLTPAAVPGLTLGCIIANIGSPMGVVDIICGASATLIAALLTRATRNIKFQKMPILSLVFPVIINALIVGTELTFLTSPNHSFGTFVMFALNVGLGEIVICYLLGIPLYFALDKTKIFRK